MFDSCAIPEQHPKGYKSVTRLTAMMGGHIFEQKFGSADSVNPKKLLEIAIKEVDRLLDIESSLLLEHHVTIQRQCIPQYTLGHQNRMNTMKLELEHTPNISLVGSSYFGVAINDVIMNSRMDAEKVLRKYS